MQKLIKTLISNCPEDTIQFAKDLSKTIPFGSTIFMVGDLGSGKTTFTLSLIHISEPTRRI